MTFADLKIGDEYKIVRLSDGNRPRNPEDVYIKTAAHKCSFVASDGVRYEATEPMGDKVEVAQVLKSGGVLANENEIDSKVLNFVKIEARERGLLGGNTYRKLFGADGAHRIHSNRYERDRDACLNGLIDYGTGPEWARNAIVANFRLAYVEAWDSQAD